MVDLSTWEKKIKKWSRVVSGEFPSLVAVSEAFAWNSTTHPCSRVLIITPHEYKAGIHLNISKLQHYNKDLDNVAWHFAKIKKCCSHLSLKLLWSSGDSCNCELFIVLWVFVFACKRPGQPSFYLCFCRQQSTEYIRQIKYPTCKEKDTISDSLQQRTAKIGKDRQRTRQSLLPIRHVMLHQCVQHRHDPPRCIVAGITSQKPCQSLNTKIRPHRFGGEGVLIGGQTATLNA